jgi:hypothetical protein
MTGLSTCTACSDAQHVYFCDRMTSTQTGRRGRPRKQIDPGTLAHDFGPGHSISTAKMAELLRINKKTLKRNAVEQGVDLAYSELTPGQLDEHAQQFMDTHPGSGYQYCHGYIQSLKLRVRRADVQQSMHRVRPLARNNEPVTRRSYTVGRPNAVWHGDDYHKLICYGIVIHGFVD